MLTTVHRPGNLRPTQLGVFFWGGRREASALLIAARVYADDRGHPVPEDGGQQREIAARSRLAAKTFRMADWPLVTP